MIVNGSAKVVGRCAEGREKEMKNHRKYWTFALAGFTERQRSNLLAGLIGLVLAFFFGRQDCFADYAVQVGSFRSAAFAAGRLHLVNAAGFPAILEHSKPETGSPLSTILVGPYKTSPEAELARDALRQGGIAGFVRVYTPAARSNIANTEQSTRHAEKSPQQASDANLVQLAAPANSQPAQTSSPPPKTQGLIPWDLKISGHAQTAAAYTVSSPDHWSKIKNTLHLAVERALSTDINLKVSGRFSYDGAYDVSNFYPERVRRDQRFDGMFHETYLDAGFDDLSLRLGRQNIVWGEVIGLFFADVVTAKDLREFLVPEFDYIRIPQWAARAEYFKGDFKLEGIWIPYMTYDRIGKPGAEFYPFVIPPPPGFRLNVRSERTPHRLEDSSFGLRASYLLNGWDLSGFYYGSMDTNPAFFRSTILAPTPTVRIRPDHERIHQAGLTMSKDAGSFVLKSEAVYTWDRYFEVTDTGNADGAVRQNFLDYIVSAEIPLPRESRINLQFFQRVFTSHDKDIIPRKVETGASFFVSTKILDEKVEPELLTIHSLNRLDYMARFKVNWYFAKNWRFVAGTAIFGGKQLGFFGRFDNRDRVFTELRYSF